uniref:Uncharacterized protein n=1 Tax=Acrobeloides nanus TaxID=290746 RepID=A0A914C016_9BILA
VLTKLNLGYNKLRSLKGMENNKMLELLLLTENQIREKNEIDILSTLPKLAILDMTGNPVMEAEGFLKKVLLQNPNLMSVNCERIQNEERRLAIKKAGKALTMDYIEKHVFKIELKTSLILKNHELQTIALDRAAVAKLQHIELMDLSWNSLENSNELAPLCRLTQLILAHNSMNTLAGESLGEKEAFINLEFLDLSYNHITSQALYRLGITRLPKLKKLCLAGNQINRLDLAVFDLKELEELDLSQNEIKSIKKKTVNQLRKLDLSWNRLKDIDGLSTPNLLVLNITNNKITTCSAIKFITQMPKLHELNCVGNPVTERRVYTEFVKNQVTFFVVSMELRDSRF